MRHTDFSAVNIIYGPQYIDSLSQRYICIVFIIMYKESCKELLAGENRCTAFQITVKSGPRRLDSPSIP
jgi:hypothetical protein